MAERLGMTVGELMERATAAEVLTWARLDDIDEEHRRQENLRRLVERARGSSR